jgi:hypothetical protein
MLWATTGGRATMKGSPCAIFNEQDPSFMGRSLPWIPVCYVVFIFY